MGAILADDVDKVAAGFVQPVTVKVDLVCKELAIQGHKGAESISGEENAVGLVEADHALGPVYHGGHDEADGVVTELEAVALGYGVALIVVRGKAELTHEHEALLGGDYLHLGPAAKYGLHTCCVVRLHVVDYQPVKLTALKQVVKVLKQLAAGGPVDTVEENGLLIQQQVRVVAYALGDGMDIFKQVGAMVVYTNPIEIIGNFTDTIHICYSFPIFSSAYASMNCALLSEHSGHTQSSGSLSKGVPGAMPLASSPSSGLYT